jgi:hypothetical protein
MINNGYLGNNLLKRIGQQQQWTPEQLAEMAKCMMDPVYFAENYIKIVHVDRGLIPLKMYDYQKEIIEKIFKNRRLAVLSARQVGKTTTAVAIILHYIIFNEHKNVGILSNKGEGAKEVLERIKLAYENLPKWMQHGIQEWNKQSIELENGCKIYAGTTTSSSIRGKSIAFLYIDECAFVEGYDDFFASVYPTISSGEETKLLMTSTPNGLNHFYKTCTGAKEGTNGYQYVEVTWNRVPGRGEKWKQETLEALNFDYEKFSQEYEAQFLGSSGTLIDGSTLKVLTPAVPIQDSQGFTVYNRPENDHIYVCIVDVSRGKGLDYSAFQIIDVTQMPYRQVAVYRNNLITPVDYADIIHRISKSYNNAYILTEINDIGGQVSDMLHFEFEIDTLLYTETAGRSGKRISSGFGPKVDKGIRTTKQVKAVGCSILKLLIEQNQLIIQDFNTINELSTFSRKGISYEAESGCHDDLVMGLVLFSWLSTQSFFKEITDINTMMKLREKTEQEIMDDLLPFGFTYDDIETELPTLQKARDVWNSW